jgi:hypothetical protein
MAMTDRVYSMSDAARWLAVSRQRVSYLVEQGRLPRRTDPVYGRLFLFESDLYAYRQAGPALPGRPRTRHIRNRKSNPATT